MGESAHVAATEDWIAARTHSIELPDGEVFTLRPILPQDRESLRVGMAALSRESRYRRFFSAMQELTEEQLDHFTMIDYVDHFAWVAIAGDPDVEQPRGVGVARYIRDRDEPTAAEFAIAILDPYQGRGLGTLLMEALARTAFSNGIRTFIASVLADNDPMLDVARGLGAKNSFAGDGLVRVDLELPFADVPFHDTAPRRVLRATLDTRETH